jgi:hypothetical protein
METPPQRVSCANGARLESSATQGDLWMELLTPRERQFVRRVIERALKRTGDPITPDR